MDGQVAGMPSHTHTHKTQTHGGAELGIRYIEVRARESNHGKKKEISKARGRLNERTNERGKSVAEGRILKRRGTVPPLLPGTGDRHAWMLYDIVLSETQNNAVSWAGRVQGRLTESSGEVWGWGGPNAGHTRVHDVIRGY